MPLVSDVYRIPKTFPEQDRSGLINQMRRAVVCIPSKITEGAARQMPKELIQNLHVSQGSLSELDTQLEIAKRLGWLQEKDGDGLESAMNRMDTMPRRLIRHQKSSRPSRLTPHASRKDKSSVHSQRSRIMAVDLSRFQESFFTESAEHVETIESGLLALEQRPKDLDLLNRIFRGAHSIKGNAGMFHFTAIAELTHKMGKHS